YGFELSTATAPRTSARSCSSTNADTRRRLTGRVCYTRPSAPPGAAEINNCPAEPEPTAGEDPAARQRSLRGCPTARQAAARSRRRARDAPRASAGRAAAPPARRALALRVA